MTELPASVMTRASELVFADYNPRDISGKNFTRLKRSLEEFGFVVPVLARKEDRLIVGGHQRVRAWTDLRGPQAEIPVIFVEGLTDERAKLLNVALNNPNLEGEYDFERLATLLQSVPDGTDLTLTGFNGEELDDILALMQAGPLPGAGEDPDELLAAKGRKFAFEVATDAEAALVRRALKYYGMTSDADAAKAFVRAMRAAPTEKPAKGNGKPAVKSARRS